MMNSKDTVKSGGQILFLLVMEEEGYWETVGTQEMISLIGNKDVGCGR
jgi:hypothetical protein